MNTLDEPVAESKTIPGSRRFRSPNRILARFFRLGRDKWKARHHAVRGKLKRVQQLAAEREASRDRWKTQCERETRRAVAAEAMVERQKSELEEARARIAAIEGAQKKRHPVRRVYIGCSFSYGLNTVIVIVETGDPHGFPVFPRARSMARFPLVHAS